MSLEIRFRFRVSAEAVTLIFQNKSNREKMRVKDKKKNTIDALDQIPNNNQKKEPQSSN